MNAHASRSANAYLGCSRKVSGDEFGFWTQVWRTSSFATERSGPWKQYAHRKPPQPAAQDLFVGQNGIANWTTNMRSFPHCDFGRTCGDSLLRFRIGTSDKRRSRSSHRLIARFPDMKF